MVASSDNSRLFKTMTSASSNRHFSMYSLYVIHKTQHQVRQRLLNVTPPWVCRESEGFVHATRPTGHSSLNSLFLSPEPCLSSCSFQQAMPATLFSLGQQYPKPPEKAVQLSMLIILGQSRTALLISISDCTDSRALFPPIKFSSAPGQVALNPPSITSTSWPPPMTFPQDLLFYHFPPPRPLSSGFILLSHNEVGSHLFLTRNSSRAHPCTLL